MDSQEGQVSLGLGRPGAGHVLASAGTDVSLSVYLPCCPLKGPVYGLPPTGVTSRRVY